MPITFDRRICCDLNETISREWLITNGLGGYAAGTVSGVLTRMQHGLLVVPIEQKAPPQLLLAKIDEEAVFDQRTYYLGTNEYRDGTLSPAGFVHLEAFRLEEGFPVFLYRIGGLDGVMLEKRIWMIPGQHTTCIQYRLSRNQEQRSLGSESERLRVATSASGSTSPPVYQRTYLRYRALDQHILELTLLPFSAYRPFDCPQTGHNDWHFQVEVHHSSEQQPGAASASWSGGQLLFPRGVTGCTIRASQDAQPYHLFIVGHPDSQPLFIPTGVWYWHFLRRVDRDAGRPAVDDLYLPGVFRARLWPDEEATLTIVATTEDPALLTLTPNYLALAYRRSIEQQRALLQPQRYFGEGGETSHRLQVLPLTGTTNPQREGEEFLHLLVQAGDRFLVRQRPARLVSLGHGPYGRPLADQEAERFSILSTFYGLEEYTRDALIALPGLMLATGRFDECRRLLRGLARHFKQGLLPDRLPRTGQRLNETDYSNIDVTLWYLYALDHYFRFSSDEELIAELYQRLAESLLWYLEGTLHGIQVDPHDGLLRSASAHQALTWMNAYLNGSPVTPRTGKAVEVNALWYHALALMEEWSALVRGRGGNTYLSGRFQELRQRCEEGFQRFWYAEGRYLYDVLDGPSGHDPSLRPNQLLAISLRHTALVPVHRLEVLEQVTRHLLTPYGLRTLAPHDPAYRGRLGRSSDEQRQALYQGSVWTWLIGPYIEALLKLDGRNRREEPNHGNATPLGQEYIWRQGLRALEPFLHELGQNMLGMISGVFDGDPPHHAGYQAASASGVAELLRIYSYLAQAGAGHLVPALSV
ncbi:MAG: glycogen debranching enzyme family protein [Thermogemmatispora sp.]|uniref:amylo-alpha-1,6-glucosidase n=1 Tax=Thermogemmatispora sp. TaxID=1968838 RepID=UPI0019E17F49|nr:amylo-alpha-1,6-glucosidase [Thermogemmatispora sp.]MBE3564239.1 glycogen debranching enzyme family protein [Thermogemmatispora sp.]